MLQTAFLVTSLVTNFRFDGWRYTLFFSTNQNQCYNEMIVQYPKRGFGKIIEVILDLS